jgi:hypothetical protein
MLIEGNTYDLNSVTPELESGDVVVKRRLEGNKVVIMEITGKYKYGYYGMCYFAEYSSVPTSAKVIRPLYHDSINQPVLKLKANL